MINSKWAWENDDKPFEEKMKCIVDQLHEQQDQAAKTGCHRSRGVAVAVAFAEQQDQAAKTGCHS